MHGIAFADYYQWEDEQGTVHITNYPPTAESLKKSKVHKYGSESNNNSDSTNKNEQKSSKSARPSISVQPTGSHSSQSSEPQEQIPPPYNCIKLCVKDNIDARKLCKRGSDNYISCIKQSKERLDDCRRTCKEEEKYATSNSSMGKNNVESSGDLKVSAEAKTSSPDTIKFDLLDTRDPAEREGYPYPKSPISHVMYGDHSLGVDRLAILKAKLIERFGDKLEGKLIHLTQFYVMEATVRSSHIKSTSGKQIPYDGPFLPSLIGEVTITLDGGFFHGSVIFRMKQGSKATKSALTIATTMIIDDLFRDMDMHSKTWRF